MKVFRRAGTALLVLWPISFLPAQPPAASAPAVEPAQPLPAASTGAGREIVLDVVVTDKSGTPVSGLQQQDFTVLDNNQPTKILAFHAPRREPPAAGSVDDSTEIVLIIDEVNTPFSRVTYAMQQVERFLRQNQGKLEHPLSLAFFTDHGLDIQTHPSIDGNAMAAALEQQHPGIRTPNLATDLVRLSQNALDSLITQERRRPARKLVIWISPGWPYLVAPSLRPTVSQEQHIFASVVGLSTALREARILMYSIDPLGAYDAGTSATSYYQTFLKGVTKPERAEFGDLGLQVLAAQSGGRSIFGNGDIAVSIDRCIADLDGLYTLSIEASPSDHADEYHDLTVKLGAPGLKARTRDGYYGQP